MHITDYLANILICDEIECKTRVRRPNPSNRLGALLTNTFSIALQRYFSITNWSNPNYDLHTISNKKINQPKYNRLRNCLKRPSSLLLCGLLLIKNKKIKKKPSELSYNLWWKQNQQLMLKQGILRSSKDQQLHLVEVFYFWGAA